MKTKAGIIIIHFKTLLEKFKINKCMKKIALLFFVLSFHQSFSQNRDSLLHVVNVAANDTNTVKALRTLAGISNAAKTREAIAFGLRGAELGKNLNWPKGIAGCYLNLGYQYNILGKLDTALFYIDSALKY